MKLFLVIISLALIGCNGQKKATMETNKTSIESAKTSSLILLHHQSDSSFDTQETMVIKDAKRLKGFYAKINRTRKPGIPLPDVDFSKEMIVIYCSGTIDPIGTPILSKEKETDTEIILSSNFQNGVNNKSNLSKTSPFCIYRMPLSDKNIVIETNFE